jgi:DNA-directed RNA polymerase subunit beta'
MSDLDTIAGVRISLASPEQIRAWSSGQVTKPDTINYQTNQPEPGGLFCERIFGPTRDWSCFCGKYLHARSPGFVCDICGVEVAPSRVRRERMGHIELVVPVVHSWLARGVPSILATLLSLSPRQLASVLAYNGYLVTEIKKDQRDGATLSLDAGNETAEECRHLLAALTLGSFLDEERYRELSLLFGDRFRAQNGAEAVRHCLDALDLDALAASLRQMLSEEGNNQKKAIRRLQIVEAFRHSGIKPSWAVLDVIPVLPPDLRHL